jgi:iron complex outermembrane receptor protein
LLHEAGTTYNGFQPTFDTDVFDNLDLLEKSTVFGFNDFSLTAGSNKVDYTVGIIECIFGSHSPTEFNVGHTFSVSR